MILWDGAFNLRDLGGLPLCDGGFTASGRVFRSGRPETLTDAGWDDLRAAGVSTVVDLRNAPERARRETDPVVAAGHSRDVMISHAPLEDPDHPDFLTVLGPWLDHPRSYADNLRLFPDRVALAFTAIAEAPGSVLVHCAGGRDRTGLVSAMLLRLAGAETDAIMGDYADAFREASRRHARDLPAAPDPDSGYVEPVYTDAQIEERIAERELALREWIDGLDVRAALLGVGVTASAVDALERRLRD